MWVRSRCSAKGHPSGAKNATLVRARSNYLTTSITRDSVKTASTVSPTFNPSMFSFLLTLMVFFLPSGSSTVTLCFWLSTARIFPHTALVSTITAPGFEPRGATLRVLILAASELSFELLTVTRSSYV